METVTTAKLIITRYNDGRLLSIDFPVLITKIMMISVSKLSINQAVLNVAGSALKIKNSMAKLSISKTELCIPNTNINFLVFLIFQIAGLATVAASTLSEAKARVGRSERKLFSNICVGSKGRNGRTRERTPILNMFPKFALVVRKIYF